MSKAEDTKPAVTDVKPETVTVNAQQWAEMQATISRLSKASIVEDTIAQCNVCGDFVDPTLGRCAKHPYDLTNHVRPATDKEKAEANVHPMSAMNTLVRQT